MTLQRIDNETFSKAFSQADESIRELLTSEKVADCLDSVIPDTDQTKRSQIMLQYGYYLLKLVTLDDLMEFMRSVGVQNPMRTMADVQECSEKPDSNNSPAPNLENDIEKVEKQMESVEPVRTMNEDMEAVKNDNVPSYQTSQEELLQKDRSDHQSRSPRWDTETEQ